MVSGTLQSKQKIPLCPLEYGVYPDVINLDRYNLFLLGLAYMSLTELLYGLLALHLFACCISQAHLMPLKNFANKSQGSHPIRQLKNCGVQEVVTLLAHPR